SQVVFFGLYRAGGLPLFTAAAALLVSATWWVVWSLTEGHPQRRRVLVFLPLLFVMWANLHGAVVLGIALLVGSIAAAAFHERRVPRGLLVSSALCLVATIMNPLKLSLWSEIPASLSRLRQYQVLDWRTTSFGDVALLPFWLMSAALTVLIAAALVGRRRGGRTGPSSDPAREERGVTIVISALILLPFALTSSRNVPPFLLLAD